jgi:transcriptional regulator with XRE-family HTH domain
MKRITGSQQSASTPSTTLGGRLRDARTARNISQRKLAELLVGTGIDQSKISRIESGERAIDQSEIAAILNALNVTGDEADEILELALTEASEPHSWTSVGVVAGDVSALVNYEHMATAIIEWSLTLVPGLLQTSETTRAILHALGTPPRQIPAMVATRAGRREIITRKNSPVHYTCYIGEAALHAAIGGQKTRIEQLEHLVAMIEALENLDVHIVPIEADWNPGHYGPTMIVQINEQKTVVVLENPLSGSFWQGEEVVAAYQRSANQMHDVAMGTEHSTGLIKRVLNQAREQHEREGVAES